MDDATPRPLADDVLVRRLGSQQLSGTPAVSPDEVVTRLLAVQAQDPRGARLAIRSRSRGLVAADVDDALDAGRLVVSWLGRGTLHLVTAQDYWWLHPLTTPQLAAGSRRRLRQEGVDPRQATRGVEVVAEAVATGPQTREQLRTALDAAGVPTRGQALPHVLLAATLEGLVVRGPMRGGEQAFVGTEAWLGPAPAPLHRGEALARLAARYLTGHGPAEAADLARWAGVTLGDARRGLAGVEPDLTTRPDGLVELTRTQPPPPPPPRLLGAFDPLLLGWVSRAAVVGEYRHLVTTNGVFRPFALVEGRAVARWGLTADRLTITPLEPVQPSVLAALLDDAEAVLRYLGRSGAIIVGAA